MENFSASMGVYSKEYDEEILRKYKPIRDAAEVSRGRLDELRDIFSCKEISGDILFIAVAGSIARMEASRESDVDLIIVLKSTTPKDAHKELYEEIWKLIPKGYNRPNPKGIFSTCISESDLFAVAGGGDESYKDLSRRVLLLLESKWIFREDNYDDAVSKLIANYASIVIEQKGRKDKNFVFLMNDVIRYFRTICVNYAFSSTDPNEKGKWPIRNIKLRHSRLLMYISLMYSFGVLSKYFNEDKVDILREFIGMEPLRRLYVIYRISNDTGYFRIAGYYSVFLSALQDREARRMLQDIEYEGRYDVDIFARLKANSDAFQAELLRFFDARRHDWSDRFFEYIIV